MSTVVSDLNKRRGRGRPRNDGAGQGAPDGENAELVDQEKDGQKRLDGMERVANKRIEDQAWKVHSLQEKRMKAGAAEKTERESLTAIMVEEGIDNYPLDDEYEAVLKTSQKAYVRKIKKED